MKDALPIIAAAITALLGFVVWSVQRLIERRLADRKRKETLYTRLVESIVELGSYGNGAPFVIESQQAWLYASDEVLKAINSYLRLHLDAPVSPGDPRPEDSRLAIQKGEARIRLAIRRDLRPRTALDEGWVDTEWRPIATSEKAIREYLDRRRSEKVEAE